MVDLGCNTGMYSTYAARLGVSCIGVDLDKHAIEQANKYSSENQLPASFLCFDLMKSHIKYGLNGNCGSTEERLKSDMVIAPALIHHIFRQDHSIESIINKICNFGESFVAIEFIAHNDRTINEDVSIKPSNLETRKWVMGTKK